MDRRGGEQPIPRPDDWEELDPAPWFTHLATPTLKAIENVLDGYQPTEVESRSKLLNVEGEIKQSAVLIPFYEGSPDEGAVMVMTRRPKHMRRHAGELAFPGGGFEGGDTDLWGTALREADEEVSLQASDVRLVGQLDHFITGGSFKMVAPFVGALDAKPELVGDPSEVDEILDISMAELFDPSAYRREQWRHGDDTHDVHFFELEGDTLWGASAFMLYRLFELLAESAGFDTN